MPLPILSVLIAFNLEYSQSLYSLSSVCFQKEISFFFLLTFMTCSIFRSIVELSMGCFFANYKVSIAIKMTFFPRKGIVAQRTWCTAIPHIIICCLVSKMKKQYCRTKQMGVIHYRWETWIVNSYKAASLALKRLYFFNVCGICTIKTVAFDATLANLLVSILLH